MEIDEIIEAYVVPLTALAALYLYWLPLSNMVMVKLGMKVMPGYQMVRVASEAATIVGKVKPLTEQIEEIVEPEVDVSVASVFPFELSEWMSAVLRKFAPMFMICGFIFLVCLLFLKESKKIEEEVKEETRRRTLSLSGSPERRESLHTFASHVRMGEPVSPVSGEDVSAFLGKTPSEGPDLNNTVASMSRLLNQSRRMSMGSSGGLRKLVSAYQDSESSEEVTMSHASGTVKQREGCDSDMSLSGDDSPKMKSAGSPRQMFAKRRVMKLDAIDSVEDGLRNMRDQMAVGVAAEMVLSQSVSVSTRDEYGSHSPIHGDPVSPLGGILSPLPRCPRSPVFLDRPPVSPTTHRGMPLESKVPAALQAVETTPVRRNVKQVECEVDRETEKSSSPEPLSPVSPVSAGSGFQGKEKGASVVSARVVQTEVPGSPEKYYIASGDDVVRDILATPPEYRGTPGGVGTPSVSYVRTPRSEGEVSAAEVRFEHLSNMQELADQLQHQLLRSEEHATDLDKRLRNAKQQLHHEQSSQEDVRGRLAEKDRRLEVLNKKCAHLMTIATGREAYRSPVTHVCKGRAGGGVERCACQWQPPTFTAVIGAASYRGPGASLSSSPRRATSAGRKRTVQLNTPPGGASRVGASPKGVGVTHHRSTARPGHTTPEKRVSVHHTPPRRTHDSSPQEPRPMWNRSKP